MRPFAHWLRRLSAPVRPIRSRLLPSVEPLESRLMPTAYTVTTTDDLLNDLTPGMVTLRDVLTAISTQHPSGNAAAGSATNSISFAIPGSGPQRILVGSGNAQGDLPAITKPVFIDGWSQGSSGYTGPPLIVLTWSAALSIEAAIDLEAGSSGSTVRGLAIDGAFALGVQIGGTSGNLIEGNFVGTEPSGINFGPIRGDGVRINGGATHNTVGGTAAGADNVISANGGDGVDIDGSSGNVVLGNRIGTDAAGTAALGNAAFGVEVQQAVGNTIGGTAKGAANVISGNDLSGVELFYDGSSGNVVLGNLIGTDVTGTAALGNLDDGVELIYGAKANTIGGTAAGAANVISANGFGGVALQGGSGFATSGNVVLGNRIGTDITGTVALGNQNNGLFLAYDADKNTIGGTAPGAGNLISANGAVGIDFYATDSGNVVLGNRIGTDKGGTVALANGGDGIDVIQGSSANTIGGTAPGAGNLISGNAGNGLGLHDYDHGNTPPAANVIRGNLIGTDATGTLALGNRLDGIVLDSEGNTVGGNVISANVGDGVGFVGENVNLNSIDGQRDTRNVVAGNLIGTDGTGTAALGNGRDGVHLDVAARGNTIGGAAPGAGNVISGNGANGVEISDRPILLVSVPPSGNVILGNLIGTDKTGTMSLGNRNDGVLLTDDSAADTVGGAAGAGNVISANGNNGVEIVGRTSKNVVLGNLIGTARGGEAPLGNNADGVRILDTAGGSTVGGAAGGRNVISGNGGDGVGMIVSSGNLVAGNFVGTDAAGTAALGNGGNGIAMYTGSGRNTVGGTAAGAANVVSANPGFAVECEGPSNLILGNLIGTDRTGAAALGTAADGVFLGASATGNTVGGTAAGAGNLIAGSLQAGVLIGAFIAGEVTTSGNVVQGNWIGTDKSSRARLGTLMWGVEVTAGAADNTLGGSAAGAGNVIAYGGKGVAITGDNATGNSILGNSIYGNSNLGIDLGDDGPTPNGANPRAFPNDGQNTPVLTALTLTSVSGIMRSVANTPFRLEFFASPGSGSAGQGQVFLGAVTVTTKPDGTWNFTAPVSPIPAGDVVTATATNLVSGDTSEFSPVGTQMLVLSDPVITSGAAAQVVTLKAQLFAGNAPLVSAPVVFTIVGLPGSVTGMVNAAGYVSVSFTVPAGIVPGSYTIVAHFAGRADGDPATADGLLTVLPQPPRHTGPGYGH